MKKNYEKQEKHLLNRDDISPVHKEEHLLQLQKKSNCQKQAEEHLLNWGDILSRAHEEQVLPPQKKNNNYEKQEVKHLRNRDNLLGAHTEEFVPPLLARPVLPTPQEVIRPRAQTAPGRIRGVPKQRPPRAYFRVPRHKAPMRLPNARQLLHYHSKH